MSEEPAEYRAPGRPSLKQAEVDRACDLMLKRGEKPTIEKIRLVVGGSPNTITPMFENWWLGLAKRIERGSAAFERLPGILALQAEAFFLTAIDEARDVVRTEEADRRDSVDKLEEVSRNKKLVLDLREKEFTEKLDERQRFIDVMQERLKDLRGQLEVKSAEHAVMTHQVEEQRVAIATLQLQLASALSEPRTPSITIRRRPITVKLPVRRRAPKKRKVAKRPRKRRGR